MGALAPAINLQFGQMSLFNQDVICRDVLSTGEKSQNHPLKTASAFGRVAGLRATLFVTLSCQESLADGRTLTVVQTRRHRTHRRQIRRRRTETEVETEVETRIHEAASTRSGGCHFSAACRSRTATCASASDDREFARTISQADRRCGLSLDQASNSAARRICSDH